MSATIVKAQTPHWPSSVVFTWCLAGLLAMGGSGCSTRPAPGMAPHTQVVNVTGIGSSLDAAREDGLRKAVLHSQGALVIAERRLVNDELSEENLSYSKGLIKDYEILTTRTGITDGLYRAGMRVTVTSNELGKRVIYASESSTIDNTELSRTIDAARRQLESERERRGSAIQVLEHLMSEFHLAFLDVKKPRLESYSENGQVHLRARFTASVNRSVFKNVCTAAKTYSMTQTSAQSQRTHTRISGSNYFEQGGFLGCGVYKAIYIPDESYNTWTATLADTGFCLSLLNSSNSIIANQFSPAELQLFDNGIVAREYRDFLTRNLGFMGTVYGKVRYQVNVDRWIEFRDQVAGIRVRPSSKRQCF